MAKPDEVAAARLARLPDAASILEESDLVSASGRKYRILKTRELDAYEQPLAEAELATAGAGRLSAGDDFTGTDRHDAKLTIVAGQVQQFADLKDLVNALPADTAMINHSPRITEDPGSPRVTEEQKTVHVVRAFLYAASRETDNDFHFIVGRDPALAPPVYVNMELSGLPARTSGAFNSLNTAREAYKTFVQGQLPDAGYHHYDPPIPIEVEGSLFFDIRHAVGPHPGPAKLRPNTIWEVHPISSLVFEPKP